MARIRWVTVALTAAVGLAACGDDAGDKGSATASKKTREAVVIERRVKILPKKPGSPADTGKVLSGSKIGDSVFCPGGTSTGVDPGPTGGGRLKVQWDDDSYRRGTETYTGTITR